MDSQNNEEIKKQEEQALFEENQSRRAKKMMLWFGIISLSMSFAGLTSAYVVSSERKDWLTDFQIPQAFYISLVAILLSSVTVHFAKKAILNGNNKNGMALLVSTFILGVGFVVLQFIGFSQIIENGYYFTGSESSITTSFIYLVVLMHLAHILVGLICLLVVIYNHAKGKYINGKILGVELAATFWHFVDILWIYLFLFFYFVR
ncbi:cytochrome c oxidase subunit 3 [Patiriisocius hiemis]|uniref:Heme-copper oxidase subunit III n=1 Tax=Patiriisocius hiemis TaxID=3075604 RepID=A0ABU2YB36_9FLAO|nr:heme-copper oxidase subunit III [Constantimarinum sp. W242]MDT0555222.1 heme-copper oxidase subunit III [Constantimarinum sp. W242]